MCRPVTHVIDLGFFDQGGICLITRGFGMISTMDVPSHQTLEQPVEPPGGAVVRAAHELRLKDEPLAARALLTTAVRVVILNTLDVQVIQGFQLSLKCVVRAARPTYHHRLWIRDGYGTPLLFGPVRAHGKLSNFALP